MSTSKRRTVTRRRFLQGMGAAGAAVGLASCGKTGQLVEPPLAKPTKPILVVVNIDGGNDWLNMMPPTSGVNRTEYERNRPILKVGATALTEIGNGVGLSIHFQGMDQLSNLGRVAWIPGIGMNNPNLSHFVSIDLWGQGATAPNGTGWLGRFADGAFSPTGDVLRGITITGDMPVMLRGASRSFVSIGGSSGFRFPAALRGSTLQSKWTSADSALLRTGFGTAAASATGDPGYDAAALTSKMFLDATQSFGTDGTLPPRTPAVLYPGDTGYTVTRLDGGPLSSGLANQLKLVAQMIASGIDAEVYFVRIGGWDTHANQAVDHPNLMRALGGSLSAFYADLEAISTPTGNARDRTMVLAWSEFGRRVRENENGTDHGTAGLAFCLGRALKGGFYGQYPNLADLDGSGNMKFTTDFRSLYATVLEGWLGRSAAQTDAILGGSYPRLGFV